MAEKKTAKQIAIERVHRLWRGGERVHAIKVAEDAKVAEKDMPEGMKHHAMRVRTRTTS